MFDEALTEIADNAEVAILDPETLEEVEEAFEPLILSLREWLREVFNIFSETLNEIMSYDVGMFFAVSALFIVVIWLCVWIVSYSRSDALGNRKR